MNAEHTPWLFDESRTEHRKALRKLEHDVIAWFITVNAQGEPHSVPVWFLWHEGRVIVLSEPDAEKVKHVRRGSPVLVHLEGGRFGNDVVVLNGTAEISERSAAEWLTDIGDVFNVKYAEGMEDSGADTDAIVAKYSAVIIVHPTKLMAW
jgi:PPOX class probable F420-dependent enzyme